MSKSEIAFYIDLRDNPNFDLAIIKAKQQVDSYGFQKAYNIHEKEDWYHGNYIIHFNGLELDYNNYNSTSLYRYYFIVEPY